ncbi:MAG: hypothetical protein Q8R02_07615 [Hyphomonadaceae bacterium]|nr:hypothetical protein [Hyphomonadaceae bacterium]
MSEVGMPGRIKAALPAGAAALAVVAAVAGASLMSSNAPSAPIVASDEPVITTSEAQPPPPGSSVPGVAFDQVPGGAVAQNMEIVVKFKDDKKVKEITDAFWKDQGSARAKFEAFKASHPEFANLTLDRVTYSNELVLVDASGASGAQRLSAMRAIAAKLKGSGDISYAEPNMTAQPGGQ